MTVLFGTVEYFINEFQEFAKNSHLEELTFENTKQAYALLKDELLFDFICDEKLRQECLKNLEIACRTLLDKKSVLGKQPTF